VTEAGKLPPIEKYQRRVASGAATAVLKRGEDVLVQAPTGAGKTAIMARTARLVAREKKKTLILTHRKALFEQLVGNPEGETEKDVMGEIAYWSGITPGRFADSSLGGIDQDSPVVVGMVETVANRIDDLDDYDLVEIDETHHASEESAEREEKGSYAAVIDGLPDASLIGFTATIFRGDEGRLHPRLEAAHREVVSIEEARAAGRIVPARTIIGRAPLDMEGRPTPADLKRDELAGRLKGKGSASSQVRKSRGDAFYDHAVEDWDRLARRKKTIVFVDSVDEIELVQRKFDAVYGAGTAVGIHGQKSRAECKDDIKAYRRGDSHVLIACQMIGEGFDVPATDAVMSLNASLSRAEMNQYAGRGVRAAPERGKSESLFIDYGTASIEHGLIEHQHEIQNVDALSAAGSRIAATQAIGRMAPAAHGDWAMMPGPRKSLAFKATPAGYLLYEIDHKADQKMGRRASSTLSGLSRALDEDGKHRALSAPELAGKLADQARLDASHYTRQGGFFSESYREECKREVAHWSGAFEAFDQYIARDEAAARRREMIRDDLQGAARGGQDSRLVRRALEAAQSPVKMLREGLSLTGVAMEVCSESEGLPLGLRAEARAIGVEFIAERVKEMSGRELHTEGKAAHSLLQRMSKECADSGMQRVLSNLEAPIGKGVQGLEALSKARRAAR